MSKKIIVGCSGSGKTSKIAKEIYNESVPWNGYCVHIFCATSEEPPYEELKNCMFSDIIDFHPINSDTFIDAFYKVHKLKKVTIALDDFNWTHRKDISERLTNLILDSFEDCHKDERKLFMSAFFLKNVDQRIKEKVDQIILLNRPN